MRAKLLINCIFLCIINLMVVCIFVELILIPQDLLVFIINLSGCETETSVTLQDSRLYCHSHIMYSVADNHRWYEIRFLELFKILTVILN